MNRSWQNASGYTNAPGFVYFTPNTPQEEPYTNKEDTSEFLAFNNPPESNQGNRFTPQHYNNPQKLHKFNNPRFNQTHKNIKNRWFGPRNYNKNANSSSGFAKSNQSFNKNASSRIEDYLHPSFMEDPWAILQKNLTRNGRFSSSTITQDEESVQADAQQET